MNINLYDVMSAVGSNICKEVCIEAIEEDFFGEMLCISCKDPFTLTITCTAKDIVEIEGNPLVCTVRRCSRCLSDVECEYPLTIKRRIKVSAKEAFVEDSSETDEISYIEDCTLDVDRLILDELFTILPMNVLCRDDCKGICKVCGINLNKSVCDCDQTVPDPRLAVFGEIFNQFN